MRGEFVAHPVSQIFDALLLFEHLTELRQRFVEIVFQSFARTGTLGVAADFVVSSPLQVGLRDGDGVYLCLVEVEFLNGKLFGNFGIRVGDTLPHQVAFQTIVFHFREQNGLVADHPNHLINDIFGLALGKSRCYGRQADEKERKTL